MKYEIETKQGNKYQVTDDSVWLWIELERELGYTVTQAAKKMSEGSLDVLTFMFYKAAKQAGKTDLKNQRQWVENEFEAFEVVDEPDPKENLETP